jgi:DNA polymerase I-like protein with 3'-5' exonuclease and polymerase domains
MILTSEGPVIVHNCTQALFSGLLIREAMVRIGARYRIVLQVHDELLLVVPDAEAETALEFAIAEMSRAPSWAPDFPAAAEGSISQNYSK